MAEAGLGPLSISRSVGRSGTCTCLVLIGLHPPPPASQSSGRGTLQKATQPLRMPLVPPLPGLEVSLMPPPGPLLTLPAALCNFPTLSVPRNRSPKQGHESACCVAFVNVGGEGLCGAGSTVPDSERALRNHYLPGPGGDSREASPHSRPSNSGLLVECRERASASAFPYHRQLTVLLLSQLSCSWSSDTSRRQASASRRRRASSPRRTRYSTCGAG